MSLIREVRPGVTWVGAIDWDRRLFDSIIPLPEGTSYNSYLVNASEKTALIDGVDDSMSDVLIDNLDALGVEKLDYIVSQHAEQDHAGAIEILLDLYPDAKVLATPKCKELLMEFNIASDEDIQAVKDGERISLGDRTLEFIHAPWVHWPDTMFTNLPDAKVLFTCDFLGSHLATSDLFARDESRVYKAAKRYYAEIMMPFRAQIKKHLARVKEIGPEIIAPSHGPIYDRPELPLDAYADWVSDDVKNQVVLPYVSMHGATKVMVEYFGEALMQRGIGIRQFDLTRSDIGELAESMVDAATIVLGSSTMLGGAHPVALYASILANALRPKTRFASVIGSYGWGGKMVEQITAAMPNLKVEVLKPVVAKGYPKEADIVELDRLADEILSRHKALKIV
jgi:flavorubredoxin